ncbi:MAG: 6-carboxytetrahydropterin synthase, partial [Saprospiraceae bacterium]|nr:6-carboxytetrahydropterin synthase [Saprospiraceae bacterium]
MSNIRLTKEFKFEMAHVLLGYDGPCKNIHGHSYGLDVTVIGSPDNNTDSAKLGMVIDFGDLKKIVR